MYKIYTISIFILLYLTGFIKAEESFDFTIEKTHPLEPPYLAIYKKDAKTLGYIASIHCNFSDTNIPIAQIIKEGFKEIKPDLVIIEGVDLGNQVLLDRVANTAKLCFEQKKSKCGEAYFAAYLANKEKVKFTGIEPSDDEIVNALKSHGYNAEDGLGYIFLLYYSSACFGMTKGPSPEKIFQETMVGHYDDLAGFTYTYKDFLRWFQSIHGNIETLSQIDGMNDNKYTSAYENNPSVYLRQLSIKVSDIRENSIRENIQKILDKNHFKRILIIYGANHYLEERVFLYNNFGFSIKLVKH
jgi:hypothetical protein